MFPFQQGMAPSTACGMATMKRSLKGLDEYCIAKIFFIFKWEQLTASEINCCPSQKVAT